MVTIYGHPPSKSNQYKVIRIAGRCSMAKSPELKRYERLFLRQLPPKLKNRLIAEFEINLTVYFRSHRSDLDNSLKIILDCLQTAKAIKNDNKCLRIVADKRVDSKNPRIEFEIKEL